MWVDIGVCGASVFPVAGLGSHRVVLAAAANTLCLLWSSHKSEVLQARGSDICDATVVTRPSSGLNPVGNWQVCAKVFVPVL